MIFKIIVLLAILIISAYTDAKENKIRNKYLFPAVILGLVLSLLFGGVNGIKSSLFGMVFPFILLYITYLLRLMGAGDIKLYCTIGAIMGFEFVVNNLVYTVFTAGVFAVILLIFSEKVILQIRKFILFITNCIIFKEIQEYVPVKGSKKIPLAIPIFIGTIIQLIVEYNFFDF